MDILIKIVALAVVTALTALILKKQVPDISMTLLLVSGVIFFLMLSGVFTNVIRFINDLAAMAGIAPAVLSPLLKTVGIAILTKLATDVCRDAGAGSLASYIELAGCAIAITISIPLLMSVLKLVSSI